MDYLYALAYAARRESPAQLRAALAAIAQAESEESTPKRQRRLAQQRRRLTQRLQVAEEFADYDWPSGESEFIAWVRNAIDHPEASDAYKRWRADGVPLRVLLQAGFRPEQ